MSVATDLPVTSIEVRHDGALCACCQQALPAVIQSWPDGAVFPLCVSCLVDMPATTLVPIVPIQF